MQLNDFAGAKPIAFYILNLPSSCFFSSIDTAIHHTAFTYVHLSSKYIQRAKRQRRGEKSCMHIIAFCFDCNAMGMHVNILWEREHNGNFNEPSFVENRLMDQDLRCFEDNTKKNEKMLEHHNTLVINNNTNEEMNVGDNTY